MSATARKIVESPAAPKIEVVKGPRHLAQPASTRQALKALHAERKAALKFLAAERAEGLKVLAASRRAAKVNHRAEANRSRLRIVQAPGVTVRDHIAVDAAGEATPIYRNLAASFAAGAELTSDALANVSDAHWIVQMLETPEERKARLGIQAASSAIGLVATAASFLARAGK